MAGLLDSFFGRFRRTARATETVGSSGARVIGGTVDEEERNPLLAGPLKYKTISDLLANVSIVAAGTRYFLNLVAKAKWKFEPAEGDTDGKFAELAESIITDDPVTPWHRIVRRAAMYRFYGFSIQEWTAAMHEDGHMTFLDIEPRAQKTITKWDTDEHGAVLGMIQEHPQTQTEIYLPRKKVVYLVDDTLNDSPQGLGLFRHIIEPGQTLRRYEQLEGFGFETDLRGIPIGRGPFADLREAVKNGKMTEVQRVAEEAAMRSFIQKHIKTPNIGLLLDSITYQTQDEKGAPSSVPKWQLELLTGGNTSIEAIANAIARKNRDLARVLGVEGLLLGDGKVGSLALSKDKSESLFLLVESALQELEQGFDMDLLDLAWFLNGWDKKLKPKMKTESVGFKDVDQISAALRDMATAGATLHPADPVIGEVRDLLGLSRPPPELVDDLVDLALTPKDDPADPEGGGDPEGDEIPANPKKDPKKKRKGKKERTDGDS